MPELPTVVPAVRSDASCEAPPIGALEPARASWCGEMHGQGASTAVIRPNAWLDTFGTPIEHATLPRTYRVFEQGLLYRSVHFLHNGHWMVDVKSVGVPADRYVGAPPDPKEPSDFGGALMRPDRAFRADAGRLVVEADTSAGMKAYVDAWPEIVITTAPEPTSIVDPRFTYGVFGGHATFGCRFENDRTPVCAAFSGDGPLFELAHDRTPGGKVFGGTPASAFRLCAKDAPDADCRDRFRLEIEPATVTLFVNGTRYMQHDLSGASLPRDLFTKDVYVYFGSWLYQPTPAVVRFHWGRLAVNP
jgi:hypothetical protein